MIMKIDSDLYEVEWVNASFSLNTEHIWDI